MSSAPDVARPTEVPAMRLGEVLRRWRLMSERSLRSVASEIGISAATLMRIEHGMEPSGLSLAMILGWLLSPPMNVPGEGR